MGKSGEIIGHWINNQVWGGESRSRGDIFDPATGKISRPVALADKADVSTVVAAAAAAFPDWSNTPLGRRARVLFAFREIAERNSDDLAQIISAEHGKVVSDARGEIARGMEVVEFACGIPHLLAGRYSEQVSTNTDVHSIRQALGVCVGITPFNFPVMVPMWMWPVAIACGNTFVLKPSDRDPSASMLVAQWLADAGLPDGVFNVVNGDKETVNALIDHPDVRAVSFVGSTPVARSIYSQAASNGKRVQALGGAKNHMVVLPDANIDTAADAAVSAGYGSAGERCMAISVVVAVGNIANDLVAAIRTRTEALTIGAGTDPQAEMGPLITSAHRDRVCALVESGLAEGAKLVVDGRALVKPEGGFFLGPCLFDEVTPSMSIYQEEIFGPVLCVVRVETYEQATDLISKNPYANGAAIFTADGGAARRFEREVDAGMVGINVAIPVPMAYYSFGGWKQSLFGDTHVHGPEGVHFYTRGKVVTSQWADPAERGPNLGFPTNQ